jgi:A/G-specific adenine glycosylase
MILSWWGVARGQRDVLPWRGSRDPWHVLVAETMLVQTQADRVAEYFTRFVDCFPTPSALAEASVGDALRIWSGLGYYRRARDLHSAARKIVDAHGGAVPSSLAALLDLPGVGAYTSRAVATFAFGLNSAPVDTNIARVLARAIAGESLDRRRAQEIADSLVPERDPRSWNLALMDFGHLICTSRSPRCSRCPIANRGLCRWQANDGSAASDPAKGVVSESKRKARFDGSDRQIRGRILRAACFGPIGRDEIGQVSRILDDSRVSEILRALIDEGLLILGHRGFELPTNSQVG